MQTESDLQKHLVKEHLDTVESEVKQCLNPLLRRVDPSRRQDWIKEIKCLLGLSEADFVEVRSRRHLAQIAHTLHALRTRIKNKSKILKKRSAIRLFPATLRYAFGHRKVLAIAFALVSVDEYELLKERHLVRASSSLFPGSRLVPNSLLVVESHHEGSTIFYFELELPHDIPQRTQLSVLKAQLERLILASIEPLESKLFMPINEEEVYKNTLSLSEQIRFADDCPQLYLNFIQQTGEWLEFHALIVMVTKADKPFHPTLPETTELTRSTLRNYTSLGPIKKQHCKTAVSFVIESLKTPFLRQDHSIDFLRAREFIVRLLADHFGTIRDYNGGLLTQNNQQLEAARKALLEEESAFSSQLNELFSNLQPQVAQSLISSNHLLELFRLSLAFGLGDKYQKESIAKLLTSESLALAACLANTAPSALEIQQALSSFGVPDQSLARSYFTLQKSVIASYILYDVTVEQFQAFRCWFEEMVRRKAGHFLPARSLRICLAHPTRLLDPRIATDRASGIVIKHLYEGLYRFNPSGIPQPALAASYETSADGLKYRFHLRESYWTNGMPVTAQDFEYAWKSILSPTFPMSYSYLFSPIKNARQVKQGNMPLHALGVIAVDSNTLDIELEYRAPHFIELCCHWVYSPLSKEIDRTHPGWAYYSGSDYVCNGPFKLLSWKKGSHITLVRNDNYWNASSVEPERIDFSIIEDPKQAYSLFQEGKLDIIGEPLTEIPLDALNLPSKSSLQTQDVGSILWFLLNVTRTPLRSKKCRQALSLAIDRQAITDNILQGSQRPAKGIIADAFSRLKRDPLPFDPIRAKELFLKGLEEQGLDPGNIPQLKLRIYNQQPYKQIAEELKKMWKEALGISLQIEVMTWETFMNEIPKRDYDIVAFSWYSWYQDSLYTLENFRYANNGMNASCWEDAYFQEILSEVEKTASPERRDELLKTAEAYISHEFPVLPICGHTFRHMKNSRIDRIYISHLGNIDLKWTTFA